MRKYLILIIVVALVSAYSGLLSVKILDTKVSGTATTLDYTKYQKSIDELKTKDPNTLKDFAVGRVTGATSIFNSDLVKSLPDPNKAKPK